MPVAHARLAQVELEIAVAVESKSWRLLAAALSDCVPVQQQPVTIHMLRGATLGSTYLADDGQHQKLLMGRRGCEEMAGFQHDLHDSGLFLGRLLFLLPRRSHHRIKDRAPPSAAWDVRPPHHPHLHASFSRHPPSVAQQTTWQLLLQVAL